MSNPINRGFNPYDTIRKTPHGRFISWISSSNKQVNNEPKKSKREIEFEAYKKDIEKTARKHFIEQEEYYDIKSGEFRYRDVEQKQEPEKKSTWQKIKDWWNGNDNKPDPVESRIKFRNGVEVF